MKGHSEVRAISWVAVSSTAQYEKESPEEQKRENERVAASIGAEIIATLVVPGHTREFAEFSEAERAMDAYRELRELLKAGVADILICRDMSRLGRTNALGQQVVNICHANGCAVYLRSSPPTTLDATEQRMNLGGQITYSIEGLFAQIEMINLRKRHQFGMVARVESGKMPGRPPFGYRKTADGMYEVDPVKGAVARQIFDLYLDGLSAEKIAEQAGVGYGTVGNMIKRCWTWAGFAQYKSAQKGMVRAEGNWEAIITESMAREIDAERERRSTARRLVSSPAAFRGAVYCALCGNRMVSAGFKKKAHGYSRTDRLYRCDNLRIDPNCGKVLVGESRLLYHAMLAVRHVHDEERWKDDDDDGAKEIDTAISMLETAIADMDGRRDRLTRAYTEGILDLEEYRARMEQTKTQRTNLMVELNRMRNVRLNDDHDGRKARAQALYDMGLEPFVEGKPVQWRRHIMIFVGKEGEIVAANLV